MRYENKVRFLRKQIKEFKSLIFRAEVIGLHFLVYKIFKNLCNQQMVFPLQPFSFLIIPVSDTNILIYLSELFVQNFPLLIWVLFPIFSCTKLVKYSSTKILDHYGLLFLMSLRKYKILGIWVSIIAYIYRINTLDIDPCGLKILPSMKLKHKKTFYWFYLS